MFGDLEVSVVKHTPRTQSLSNVFIVLLSIRKLVHIFHAYTFPLRSSRVST